MMDVSKRRAGATDRARGLRRGETEAEYRLWGELRNRLLNGYKFARQVPLGPYFADFVCREGRLIIELDGSQHAVSSRDDDRTSFLNAHGYSILRFWNEEVLRERQDVLGTILAALEGRLAPSPGLRFAPATLSPRGEEGAHRGGRHGHGSGVEHCFAAASPLPHGERVATKRPGEGGVPPKSGEVG